MNKWQKVWNKRALARGAVLDLDALMRLDGFDSGVSRISAQDWRTSTIRIANILGIEEKDSIFEFGCGAGAFLFALAEQKEFSGGGGVDYSQSLVEIARRALPRMDFICAEAIAVQTTPQYDHCVSHSMFQYFENDYAREVLQIMAAKAKKTVTVLDIPNAASRQAAERIRRDRMGPDEYERKYAGLPHNYYERKWFKQQAEEIGLTCEFIDNQTPNYAQKDFRYGCVMRWMD